MAFPPEFSSTATYANRYDLDEISVFLEGDSTNPMFFDISGLPQVLSFGKHYFNLSILDSTTQDYELAPNSQILFEFKSINNVVLKSDLALNAVNQRNGVSTGFVEVLQDPLRTFEEIQDGQGTLMVVGSLINKPNVGEIIPEKFVGAMNYRCVFPINIRKNLINANSPFQTNVSHKRSTLQGQFSFVSNNISPVKGGGGQTYNSTSGKPSGVISVPAARGSTN